MSRFWLLIFEFGLVSSPIQSVAALEAKHLTLYMTHGSFDLVRENVEIVITNRGLVVDHISHLRLCSSTPVRILA